MIDSLSKKVLPASPEEATRKEKNTNANSKSYPKKLANNIFALMAYYFTFCANAPQKVRIGEMYNFL